MCIIILSIMIEVNSMLVVIQLMHRKIESLFPPKMYPRYTPIEILCITRIDISDIIHTHAHMYLYIRTSIPGQDEAGVVKTGSSQHGTSD